jgi:hypothetical protein
MGRLLSVKVIVIGFVFFFLTALLQLEQDAHTPCSLLLCLSFSTDVVPQFTPSLTCFTASGFDRIIENVSDVGHDISGIGVRNAVISNELP